MRIALLIALIVCLLAPAVAAAAGARAWATVNVCDTARQPDAVGIRASMPGAAKGARLSMRFRVQYRDRRRRLGRRGRGRLRLARRREPGAPRPSPAGASTSRARPRRSTLRGVVRFRWRRGDSLPRQDEVVTEAGHRSSAGADPAGYSAATCVLT